MENETKYTTDQLIEKLATFEKQIKDLSGELEELSADRPVYNEQIKAADLQEQQLLAEFEKKMEEVRKSRSAARSRLSEISQNTAGIQNSINLLREKYGDIQKMIAAQEKLDELWDSLAKFFEESPWGDAAKEFQKEDIVAAISQYQQGAKGILNANVMGSGKTFECGATLDIITHLFYREHGRKPLVLWLTRKSLLESTPQELLQWNEDRKFAVIQGKPEIREFTVDIAVQSNLWCFINYEGMNTTPKVMETKWDIVVMDECHKLKGGEKVKVFHNTKELTERAKFFIGLSGSPIQNTPEDIWPVFNILDPVRHPTVHRFQREFVREVYDQKTGEYVTGVKEEKLIQAMQGKVIKQDPAIVQASWPDKHRIFRPCEHTEKQREAYDRAKMGVIKWAQQQEDEGVKSIAMSSVIAQLTYLRQINVWPGGITWKSPDGDEVVNFDVQESGKIDEAMELLEELIGEGEQVVIWSAQFNGPLLEMEQRIKEAGWSVAVMNGNTKNPQVIENLFQQGEIDILLCNRAAVNEGFNFQKNPSKWPGGAKTAIFLDQWWNPKANEQAEDRIWRTGADQKVKIYYLIIPDSVDAFIGAKLEQKEGMINSLMNSESLRPSEMIGLLEDLL